MKKILCFLIVSFGIILTCNAYERLNFNGGFISDNAKIITDSDYRKINGIINELQQKTKADIAVVTVTSLQGDTVENTALKIGRDFKVGSKERNNGVVLLVAPNERLSRIEVGYGLEDIITNSLADDVMNNTIIPQFKNNNYSLGIYNGVVRISNIIAAADGVTLESTQGVSATNVENHQNNDNRRVPWWFYLLAIPIALFSGKGSRGRFGGGGGFGGGHGSTGRW